MNSVHSEDFPSKETRHHKVKTWTRRGDIFSKEFLVIILNENKHWSLALVCNPGLVPQESSSSDNKFKEANSAVADPIADIDKKKKKPKEKDSCQNSPKTLPPLPPPSSSLTSEFPSSAEMSSVEHTQSSLSDSETSSNEEVNEESSSDSELEPKDLINDTLNENSSNDSLNAFYDIFLYSSSSSEFEGFGKSPEKKNSFNLENTHDSNLSISSVHTSDLSSYDDELSSGDEVTASTGGLKKRLTLKEAQDLIKNRVNLNEKKKVETKTQTGDDSSNKRHPQRSSSLVSWDEAEDDAGLHQNRDEAEDDASLHQNRDEAEDHAALDPNRDEAEDHAALDPNRDEAEDHAALDPNRNKATPESVASTSSTKEPSFCPKKARLQEEKPCIFILDSMVKGKNYSSNLKYIREYLEIEWKKKKGTTKQFDEDTMPGYIIDCPQQHNLYDCGVFVLQYVESFFENPYFDSPIPNLSNWFPEEKVAKKRQELTDLIFNLQKKYANIPHNL